VGKESSRTPFYKAIAAHSRSREIGTIRGGLVHESNAKTVGTFRLVPICCPGTSPNAGVGSNVVDEVALRSSIVETTEARGGRPVGLFSQDFKLFGVDAKTYLAPRSSLGAPG
jgi:hypothetical protein